MTLSSSPSLDEYKDGIPPRKRENKIIKWTVRGIIAILSIVLVILAYPSFLSSDAAYLLTGKGSIVGIVIDERNKPLVGEVFIIGNSAEEIIAEDGGFQLNGIPSGSRSLVIAYQGTAVEFPVQVIAGTTVSIGEIQVIRPAPISSE